MELKAKLLQVTKEKDDLAKEKYEISNQRLIEAPPSTYQQVETADLTKSLAQVSLKEKEISQLLQERNQLKKSNQEKQDRIDRLKDRLLGKEVLKSAQHSLWDVISIEVNKFWSELKRMEAKKAYIYSAIEKHKLATEQLGHLHKEPIEKAQSVINFLKFSSDEALQAFKVTNRYQTIMFVKRVLDRDELMRKVHNRIEALQKEIKETYAIFKPLIEKGLPHFWDAENKLLKKEQYEDLIVSKRNDHSNFEDLEGNLRGEVLVAKLGDVFDLEILVIQMKEVMLPTRNQFKELIKMVAKPLGLIPLTYE